MIDIVALQLTAGSGGMGRVSFRREKYVLKGGPDGGAGGNGGSIFFRAERNQSTLKRYSGIQTISAQAGKPGGARNCTGGAAADITVSVPVGTCIWQVSENSMAKRRRLAIGLEKKLQSKLIEKHQFSLEKEGASIPALPVDSAAVPDDLSTKFLAHLNLRDAGYQLLATLDTPGQELVICQGGMGGRRNQLFKSSRETTPLRAEYGTPGEERWVVLEQQLLADVGLIGLPNVGKSTLLSVLTQATPAIGAYPFTTLEPQLGMLVSRDRTQECVVADIPGLLAGASTGKGLGLAFLRHVRHCRGLLFVLSVADASLMEPVLQQVASLHAQLAVVHRELLAYDPSLLEIASVVCVTKIDLYTAELVQQLSSEEFAGAQPILVSAATHTGLTTLHAACLRLQSGSGA